MRYHLSVLFTVAVLSGCATQSLPPVGNWADYQARLSQVDTWQLQGKLGVRLPGNADSVHVDWVQAPNNYDIRLSGPFGQGTTWIRGSADNVSLEQAGSAPVSATTPEALIFDTLGWDIPIRDLYYWVRGIPAPEIPVLNQEKSAAGALAYLEQAGWQLSFSRYNAIGPWQLPGKIVAQRDQLTLTLIIKQWRMDVP